MTAGENGELRIGTSGYQYDHWAGDFYPEGLSKKNWFEHYTQHFDTVEINNTFYHLPDAATFDDWRERAPQGFRYVLKFSRYGSHLKHLKDPEGSIGMFLERAERLKSYLGPILVQLPPQWNPAPERLDAFLAAAPRRRRWAVEFRNRDWLCDEIYDILRRNNAALCIHDLIDEHPREITADWVYLRYHGIERYSGSYPHQALSADARRIEGWLGDGLDVFAYFNNDIGGHAPRNAMQLREYVTAP